MGINIGNELSKIKVYRNEEGKYKTYIPIKEKNDKGEYEFVTAMSKKLDFGKNVELKNQTVIEVKKGWLSAYRIKTDEVNEQGKPIYKYFDKYFISEFDVIEEGIEENQKSRHKQNEQKKQETQEDFSFDFMSDDELPF